MSDVEMSSRRYLSFNIFSGLMKTSARSFAAGGCYFFLDKKVTKKSSQSECFLPALPVLNAFLDVRRLTHAKKLNQHSRHTPGPPALTFPALLLTVE
jgi:hypothetical protein